MGLPKLTSLQFAVIDCLQANRLKGRELRAKLDSEKEVKREGPAFYMMMSRMESGGFVESEVTEVVIDGKIYSEKTYWVSTGGRSAYEEARSFFEGSSDWLGDAIPQL